MLSVGCLFPELDHDLVSDHLDGTLLRPDRHFGIFLALDRFEIFLTGEVFRVHSHIIHKEMISAGDHSVDIVPEYAFVGNVMHMNVAVVRKSIQDYFDNNTNVSQDVINTIKDNVTNLV